MVATPSYANDKSAAFRPLALARSFARGEAVPTTVPCDVDAEGCLAICYGASSECSVLAPVGVLQRLKVGGYFALWFLLSVGYSLSNKVVNNMLPCPCAVATSTVTVGSVFVGALWLTGLRAVPRLSRATLRVLLPIGLCHAIGHMAGTFSVAVGSVSFTQIVKAANPLYVCALSAALLRQPISARVWLSLLPIVAGVALATVKEVSFVWGALVGAAASDLAMALRNVLSKRSLGLLADVDGRRLTSTDLFSLLTVISTLASLPIALAVDGRALPAAWASAAASVAGGGAHVLTRMGLTGLLFYAYNEVAMLALSSVHQVRPLDEPR